MLQYNRKPSNSLFYIRSGADNITVGATNTIFKLCVNDSREGQLDDQNKKMVQAASTPQTEVQEIPDKVVVGRTPQGSKGSMGQVKD